MLSASIFHSSTTVTQNHWLEVQQTTDTLAEPMFQGFEGGDETVTHLSSPPGTSRSLFYYTLTLCWARLVLLINNKLITFRTDRWFNWHFALAVR